MSNIRIVADSTCDLGPELTKAYHITVVPLCIVMDEKSYYDGEEVTPDEIYTWADRNKTTPKTAAVSFEKMGEIIGPMMEAGDDVIFFCISSHMSSTCNVGRIFGEQQEKGRLFVVDSLNLSTGIGLQVLRAAELAAEGKSAEEIVAEIEAARPLVRASFIVDTLTYLARGGRCTAVTALMANTLKLHPMIVVKDGSMGVSKKYRGKMTVALQNYVADLAPALREADPKRVFITHSGCSAELIGQVRAQLEELGVFEEILVTRAGGVISSHCGPNTLGVLFYQT
ncbi:MAG: DegV family protein [Clostridia bacterium]|nr:DegV family protein [Clostridia bacterium]